LIGTQLLTCGYLILLSNKIIISLFRIYISSQIVFKNMFKSYES